MFHAETEYTFVLIGFIFALFFMGIYGAYDFLKTELSMRRTVKSAEKILQEAAKKKGAS